MFEPKINKAKVKELVKLYEDLVLLDKDSRNYTTQMIEISKDIRELKRKLGLNV